MYIIVRYFAYRNDPSRSASLPYLPSSSTFVTDKHFHSIAWIALTRLESFGGEKREPDDPLEAEILVE